MYFVLSKNKANLPYHKNINGLWLSTLHDVDMYGYQLGDVGGNYVNFTDSSINFSLHKDYKLYSSEDIILTNIEINGSLLPSNIISFDFLTHSCTYYEFSNGSELSYDLVVKNVYDILLENLNACAKISEPKIVYTAGLDSSTLAYMAHANNIDFTCLIDSRYKDRFKNLPFANIEYVEFQRYPEFEISYGPVDNIKEGFYQPENNMLITGYYGDNSVVHNTDMFYQAKHLHPNPDDIFLYHIKEPSNYTKYNSKQEMLEGIKYINSQNYFRHWFDNFQILDPYRDPRLSSAIMQLSLFDLIEQVGSAKIQKDIIASLDSKWLDNLCEHKNDYSKF